MRPIHSIHYSIAFFNSSWRGTLKTTTLILYEEKLVAALNATSNSITDVQVALAEVYEMVLGGN